MILTPHCYLKGSAWIRFQAFDSIFFFCITEREIGIFICYSLSQCSNGTHPAVVLQLRIYAMYAGNRKILALIVTSFGSAMIASIILIVRDLEHAGSRFTFIQLNILYY